MLRNCTRILHNPATRHYASAPLAVMNHAMDEVMDSIHKAGTFKPERVITTRQAAEIQVAGGTKKILNFCANNYLGLSVSRKLRYWQFGKFCQNNVKHKNVISVTYKLSKSYTVSNVHLYLTNWTLGRNWVIVLIILSVFDSHVR